MSDLHKDLKAVVEESPDANLTYSQALSQLNVKMLNATEMFYQEGAWYVLGLGMAHTNRVVLSFNRAWPERVRIQKSQALMEINGLEETSTSVWCKTSV